MMSQCYEFLQQKLQVEREKLGRELRFMLLDYVEHLLDMHQPLETIPLEEPRRSERIHQLRQQVLHSLGLSPLPRRTSLRPQSAGMIEREGYKIEKLVFYSRPHFAIPALLYLPSNASYPVPAILYISGHFVEDGMMHPDSQSCCIALAKLGFAVFAYEAMGQGCRGSHWEEFRQTILPTLVRSERLQSFQDAMKDELAQRKWMAWAWHCLNGEHNQPPLLLVGLCQTGLMVWESIRALDYLSTRKEIDSTRLGVMGASGGGQNAYYTAALDKRAQAVVSICYLPSLREQIRLSRGTNWWGSGDLCDQIPQHLTYAEFADIGALILPRPLLFVVARQDEGFPIAAARQEYRRLSFLYEALAPGRLQLTEVDGPHGLSQPMREAAYGWFKLWLQGEGDGKPVPEPPMGPEPIPPVQMHCFFAPPKTPSKSTVISLTKRTAARLSQRRTWLPYSDNKQKVLRRLEALLGPAPRDQFRVHQTTEVATSHLTGKLRVMKSGWGISLLATTVQATDCPPNSPLIIIVHEGNWHCIWEEGWVKELVARGCRVCILDTRGTGYPPLRTARPADQIQALQEILLHQDEDGPFVTDFEISSAYLMLGRSLLGERMWDLRLFLKLVIEDEKPFTGLKCLGIGQGGLVALLAAVLDPRIDAVAMWSSPASFQSLIVEEPSYPLSTFLFGVLHEFDLPEITATIAPRIAIIANPCNGNRHPLPATEAAETYRYTIETYTNLGVPERCQILVGPPVQTRLLVCERLACHTNANLTTKAIEGGN